MVERDIKITIGNQPEKIRAPGEGIKISIQGKPVSGQIRVTGIVYLVIDCSISMAGGKLIQARQGAIDFAGDALTKGYSVGLIQFATHAYQICDPQREIAQLRSYVEQVDGSGSTNMAAGIDLATQELGQEMASRAIVLVTDGHPDDRASALDAAGRAKRPRPGKLRTLGDE